MLKVLSKEEHKEHHKRLKKFVKNNHCEMYNYMRDIENFRNQGITKERFRIIKLVKKMKIEDNLKKNIVVKIMEQATIELKESLERLQGKAK